MGTVGVLWCCCGVLWCCCAVLCCSVLLLISAAVVEAKLQPAERESARDWPCPLCSLHVATELEQGDPNIAPVRGWEAWSVFYLVGLAPVGVLKLFFL